MTGLSGRERAGVGGGGGLAKRSHFISQGSPFAPPPPPPTTPPTPIHPPLAVTLSQSAAVPAASESQSCSGCTAVSSGIRQRCTFETLSLCVLFFNLTQQPLCFGSEVGDLCAVILSAQSCTVPSGPTCLSLASTSCFRCPMTVHAWQSHFNWQRVFLKR